MITNTLDIGQKLSKITYARFRKIWLGDMKLNEIYFFVTDYSNIRYKVQEDHILEGIPLAPIEVKYGVKVWITQE
jgi:hypothetical protein